MVEVYNDACLKPERPKCTNISALTMRIYEEEKKGICCQICNNDFLHKIFCLLWAVFGVSNVISNKSH